MTVKELIEKLMQIPNQNKEVVLIHPLMVRRNKIGYFKTHFKTPVTLVDEANGEVHIL